MADKKLSSVSAVSDMNFVYAETSSGETVKISKADLASVVAGLLPVSTKDKKGLMNAGIRAHTGIITVPAKGSTTLPKKVAGLLMIKNGYSWGGYMLCYCYMDTVVVLGQPSGYAPLPTPTISGGIVTVSTVSSENRQYRYVILNMSDPNDYAEYLNDNI